MKPYLSPAKFKIFAHRGSTEGGAQENTIPAFEFARSNGVSFMETDVQATSDGVAVVFHDNDLRRSFGVRKAVSACTHNELRAIADKHGVKLSTLGEVLEALPTVKFNIDFKDAGAVKPGVQAIMDTKAEMRVLVSSFSHRRRLAATRLLPDVATSGDAITLLQLWLFHKFGFSRLFASTCKSLDALQIPIKFGPLRFDSPNFIAAVTARNLEIHFWTINDFEEAMRLKALGANGIVTDQSKMMFERFTAERIEII